ncbi:MAG: MFS transporter [Myxococcaceae bacterium]
MTEPVSLFFAFRFRDYRLFQIARVLSVVAAAMISVAVGWHMYALTGRALDLGYVGLAQFLPFMALSAAGGHTADRFDRRAVFLFTLVGQAFCALALWALTRTPQADTRPLYAVLVILGAVRAFAGPPQAALTPRLVPKEALVNAITLSQGLFQVALVLGPALGGVLYGITHEAASVFGVAALMLLLAFVFVFAIRTRTGRSDDEDASWSSVLAGFRFVWKNTLLLGCFSLDLFAVLLGGTVALLPIFARDVLSVGPEGLGLLRAAPAIGAALVAIGLARFPLEKRVGRKMLVSVALFGVFTVVFGLSASFPLSFLALVILGAADMVSVVVRSTIEQLATPEAMRGRVGAVNQIFVGASNELGAFRAGLTAQAWGAIPSVVWGGIAAVLIVAAWAFFFPVLRRVNRLSDIQA